MGHHRELSLGQYILWLLDFVQTRGVTAEQLLKDTGLNEASLMAADLRVSNTQHVSVIKNLIDASDDPAIGLIVGLERFISTLDRFGYALMSCATFREALQVGTKYQRVIGRFSGRHLVMSCFQKGETAVIQIDDDPAISDLRVFAIEEIFGCTMSLSKWVTGKPLQVSSVHCRYSPRSYVERYQDIFHCPIYFNEPCNQIRFDARLLDDPLPQASSHSANIYRMHCDDMVAQMQNEGDDEFVLRVRHAISSHPQACPGSEDVAEKLCLSERSLRRKLNYAGVSFQQLVNEVREGIARQHLLTSRRSIEDIAGAMGFGDPTSFSRAFKRWSGMSPRQFRKQQENQAPGSHG